MTRFLQSLSLFALIFLCSCSPCPADDHVAVTRTMVASFEDGLVAAIYLEEGGDNTRFKYGVENIIHGKPYPFEHPERVCRNTIEHSWSKFTQQREQTDFIVWLGSTYAADPLWADKVKRLMAVEN